MFDDDDDELDTPTEFEDWFDDNYYHFDQGNGNAEPAPELERYYLSVYKPVMAAMPALVRQVMYRHYPEIETEMRPALVNEIERRILLIGQSLLIQVYILLDHLKKGHDIKTVYRDFQAWEEYLKSVMVIRRSMFDRIEGLTPQQKNALYQLMLDTFKESYNFKDQRRYEFIETIQPLLFSYIPALESFGYNEWVVMYNFYAIEHTEFRLNFEYFQTFIHYGFEEKDFFRPYAEYRQLLTEKVREELEQQIRENEKNQEGDNFQNKQTPG